MGLGGSPDTSNLSLTLAADIRGIESISARV